MAEPPTIRIGRPSSVPRIAPNHRVLSALFRALRSADSRSSAFTGLPDRGRSTGPRQHLILASAAPEIGRREPPPWLEPRQVNRIVRVPADRGHCPKLAAARARDEVLGPRYPHARSEEPSQVGLPQLPDRRAVPPGRLCDHVAPEKPLQFPVHVGGPHLHNLGDSVRGQRRAGIGQGGECADSILRAEERGQASVHGRRHVPIIVKSANNAVWPARTPSPPAS